MKGLILKDLYTLKKQFSFIGIYIILIAVMAVLTDGSYTLIAAVSVLVVMSPMTAMAYDHQCQWEKYADALPVKRSTVVMSRYFLGILLVIPMFLYDIIINILNARSFSADILLNSVYISLLISTACIVALSVTMPFIFKFGVEKGRIIMIIFGMIIAAGTGAFLSADILGNITISETLINILRNKVLLSSIVIASAAVILIISITVSIKMYEKKEF